MKNKEIKENNENKEIKENNKSKEIKENQIEEVDFVLFKVSCSVFWSWVYLLSGMMLHIANRILFNKLHFRYNIFLMFTEKTFVAIFFYALSKTKKFKEIAGELSFDDFYKIKYQYIFFTFISGLNSLTNALSNQTVKNSATFFSLRKLSLLFNFAYDIFINKKHLKYHYIVTIILVIIGNIISNSADIYITFQGFFWVCLSCILTVIYGQTSENFKKKNGVSNLKLIIYSSILSSPVLFILIFTTGEHNKIIEYFNDKNSIHNIKLFSSLFSVSFLALIFNCSIVISYGRNSSMFMMIINNCKDIFLSFAGCFFLNEFEPNSRIFFGIIVSTIGAMFFTFREVIDKFFSGRDQLKEIKTEEVDPIPVNDHDSDDSPKNIEIADLSNKN